MLPCFCALPARNTLAVTSAKGGVLMKHSANFIGVIIGRGTGGRNNGGFSPTAYLNIRMEVA